MSRLSIPREKHLVKRPHNPNAPNLPLGLMIVGLLVYLFVFILYGFLVVLLTKDRDLEKAGLFGDMFGALNAFVSGLAMLGIIAALYLQQRQNQLSERTHMYAVLAGLFEQYNSPEMMNAIRALWEFFEQNQSQNQGNHGIGAAYEKVREMKNGNTPDSLHHRRRRVSMFYQLLSGIYELRIVPSSVIFTYWSSHTLRIIPLIIIPIEKKLAESLGDRAAEIATHRRMMRLYDDCVTFEKSASNFIG